MVNAATLAGIAILADHGGPINQLDSVTLRVTTVMPSTGAGSTWREHHIHAVKLTPVADNPGGAG